MKKLLDPRKNRGLAPRALVSGDERRTLLESLDAPRRSPAAAFVQAALEAAAAPAPSLSPTSTPATASPAPTPAAATPAPTASPHPPAPATPAPAPAPATPAPADSHPRPERSLERVPLSAIDLECRRFQYRVSRNLEKLQESLLLQGQQVPVILRGAAPPYQVVSGFGRCDAIALAHAQGRLSSPFVWADVRRDLSDQDAHEISVLENEDRESLSDLDRVCKASKLRDEGYAPPQIARILRKGLRMVHYYLSLAAAPRQIATALSEGRLRPTHALVLTKFARDGLAELTPAEVEARIDDLVLRCARGASLSELRLLVARAVSRDAAAPAPRLLLPRAGGGFELRGFHYSRELPVEARQALLEVLEEARRKIAAELD